MKSRSSLFTLALVCGFLSLMLPTVPAAEPVSRTLSRLLLEDKIRGGWAGQMIGVALGAPTEFQSLGKILESDLPWSPDRVENALHQDDLYVEMTFAGVMDRVGLGAASRHYGEAFRDSKYDLWHANAAARRNLARGLPPPWSGHPKYNFHANDIDFQIEADFIGLMCPGLPQEANRLCERVGRVMNHGDGLYGGMFIAGMYSAAFFESDPRRVVEAGLASLPAESGYARIIREVLDASARHPDNWREVWQTIQDHWDEVDSCPEGALKPFNIDARLNGAYVAIGLLHGGRDFARTLEITTRCGQDSDCNPSSAGGVLGTMLGYDAIPELFRAGIPAIADLKFDFTDYSFNDICRSTLNRALKAVERARGVVTADAVEIPLQGPKPAKLEQWNPGIAYRSILLSDRAWRWSSSWTQDADGMTSDDPGAEATVEFNGVAVAIVGRMGADGGRADVYLDGRHSSLVLDAWVPERTHDTDLWRAYDLKPGRHTLKIVIRPLSDTRSTGRRVTLGDVIVYAGRAE